MSHQQDQYFMERALTLATVAAGRTSPNPTVGCVIVKDGLIVGEGFHPRAGEAHAEIHALRQAGSRASGACVYVTLEPCSHFGKTPPCADALIGAQVRRVVAAMTDPNPQVTGRGLAKLAEAGVETSVGLLAERARLLNEPFCKAVTQRLPFVLYKSAMTLDGKISAESGDSRWVTGEKAREYVHSLRNFYDVIMVGSGTIQQDDPALTCRLPSGRDPVRLVVDGSLRLSLQAQVLQGPGSCVIAVTSSAPAAKIAKLQALPNVEVWQYDRPDHVPLRSLLQDVVRRGWNGVLLEGGGGLAGSLAKEQLIDKIEFIIAPKLIGGRGPSPLTGLRLEKMAQALPLQNLATEFLGNDLKISAYLTPVEVANSCSQESSKN